MGLWIQLTYKMAIHISERLIKTVMNIKCSEEQKEKKTRKKKNIYNGRNERCNISSLLRGVIQSISSQQ